MKNYSNEEYREALDIELIKKLQRKFSTVARVSICCIDRGKLFRLIFNFKASHENDIGGYCDLKNEQNGNKRLFFEI